LKDAVITQLDSLVETGKGDDHYRRTFHEILSNMCAKHKDLDKIGVSFVETISALMEKLLMYRSAVTDDSLNNEMSCAEILIVFYGRIEQWKLHLKYVYRLFELHKAHDNHTEAAYTLLLHYKLLQFSDDKLPRELSPSSQLARGKSFSTCEQLKIFLAYEAVELFQLGQMWEAAVDICQDLCKHCEQESFDYVELSKVLELQAKFYRLIVKKERFDSEYYRVAFFGRGFPAFLQNKEFICRGSVYERLQDFQSRILNQFPNAELTKTLEDPSEDVMESPTQRKSSH
jgi:dedicator of cytokinesis protein 1